jgi:glyoxylase-like metal-dependent hydrolase (beta-lactamase superfamily II)
VITHANIDHFMGLLDLAPRLGVREVITARASRGPPRTTAQPQAVLKRAGRALASRTASSSRETRSQLGSAG